jgi:hypothetical protein
MNDQQQPRFSPRTTAFGDMILRLMEVIEKRLEVIGAWQRGDVPLFVSTDGVRMIPADRILHQPAPE